MESNKKADGWEPFENVNQYTFAMIQHSLTEEMAVMDFDSSDDRTFLVWMYALRANRLGLVGLVPEQMARMLGDEPENTRRRLDRLQKCCHVYQDRLYIILTDWRRRMFGSEGGRHGGARWKRDADGLLVLSKGMCRTVLKSLRTLTPDGQAVYLAACGMDENGLRAKARPKQDQSKINASSTQNQCKPAKGEVEGEVEVESEGGGEDAAAPSTSQNDNDNDPLSQALLREFQVRSPKPAQLEGLQAFSMAFRRVFKRLPDASTAASVARRMRADMIKWSEGIGRERPYYLGNVLEPAFAAYLAERYGDSTHACIFWNEIGGDGQAAQPAAGPADPPDPPRRARRRRKPDLGLSKHPAPAPAPVAQEADPFPED